MREIIVVIGAYEKEVMLVCADVRGRMPIYKKIIKKKKGETKDTAIINTMLWFLSIIPENLAQPVRTKIIMPTDSIKSINPITRQLLRRIMAQNIVLQSYMSLSPDYPSNRMAKEIISYMWSVLINRARK